VWEKEFGAAKMLVCVKKFVLCLFYKFETININSLNTI